MAGVADEDAVEEGGGKEAVFAVGSLGACVVDCGDEDYVAQKMLSNVEILGWKGEEGLCRSPCDPRLLRLIYRGCGPQAV